MQRMFRTWLAGVGSAWPTAYSPYWRALPVGRMKMLLAGTFLIASAVGFALDLMQLKAPPAGRGLFWPFLAGAAATAVLLAVIKRVRLIPLLYVLTAAIAWVGYRASQASALHTFAHLSARSLACQAAAFKISRSIRLFIATKS